ncbi:MAG TPA: diguanylate cyclase [Planctomycetota bacterium]
MTDKPPTASPGNPLIGLPSVLAIRDLQRRLRHVLSGRPVGEDQLVKILQLDPLSVLRGLRVANSPVFGSSATPLNVRRLVQVLGPAMSARMLDTEPVTIPGTSRLRPLWLHAIATAQASHDLASRDNVIDPETAYLLGLVHDLPEWLTLLTEQFETAKGGVTATEWVAHWQLPAQLLDFVREFQGPPATTAAGPFANACELVRAAELLANLANFGHDITPESLDPDGILGTAERTDLVAAQHLRRRVEASLRTFGLDPTVPDVDLDGAVADLTFRGKRRGNLDEVLLNVLGCARSESYRGIVTVMTAASVRYGSYDCAFYGKWNQAQRVMTLRSKSDSSARHIRMPQVVASPDEAASLQLALRDERPVILRSHFHRRQGILGALAADEVMAVPMNLAFAMPGFLLLDRTLSLTAITGSGDAPLATTLGISGSLLNENLLLRRRRQRAQKFSVTDSLTRLFNRRMGLLALEQEIARADRFVRPLTVLMCDLDHFKQLNDRYGHLEGDVALRATADVLRQTLRKGDTICRYGGEEFLVVLAGTSPDDATVLATRLFTAVQERGVAVQLPISISIGLTCFKPGDTIETLLQRADRALYASKGLGRNRFSADVEAVDEVRPVPP